VNGWNGAFGDVNTRLLNGAWHHVAVTHNGATHTAKFYIDNVLLNTWNDSGGANLAAGRSAVHRPGFGRSQCLHRRTARTEG